MFTDRVSSGALYRISPPRFLAECCKRQLNQGSFVLLYFWLSTFSDLYWVVYLYFPVLFCSSVSVKWLAVKTASEMTYTVSSGALNSTPTNQPAAARSVHADVTLIGRQLEAQISLPVLQILPTAALPFSSSGFTTWIPQTVYCYFWAYLFSTFSISVFTLFSCWFRAVD